MNESTDRLSLALRSLDGLSVGDAFGQCFFNPFHHLPVDGKPAKIPTPPWRHTDDTEMACAIVEQLAAKGQIDQAELAQRFATRFMKDPDRGYGGTVKKVLTDIYCGEPWQTAAARVFDGAGSMGNGSAMRVAPVGAYFFDDVATVVREATKSAEPTHVHPQGIAGAIAVAVAAAFMADNSGKPFSPRLIREFFETVIDYTPLGEVRDGVERAMNLPRSSELSAAVRLLGNGERILCSDTVPLCLWLSAKFHGKYMDSLWKTAAALGDIDTNCAIVGGIISLSDRTTGVPAAWKAARGRLPFHEVL